MMRIATVLAIVLFGAVAACLADTQHPQAAIQHYPLNIPRQTLDMALKDLAQQTGLQIGRFSERIDGSAMVGPVEGVQTPAKALEILLRQTGLKYKIVGDTTFAIYDPKAVSTTGKLDGKVPMPARNQILASAQADPVRSSGADSNSNKELPPSDKLDEIVVTARKTEQSLQDVGFSISATSGESLERRGYSDFDEFASSVPSLSFGYGGESRGAGRTIAIRGIGGGSGSRSGGATTGFYIDETPVPFGNDPKFIDVDRIEVLRGPQGSLYGARSMGGAVRILTKRPDSTQWSAHLRSGLSNTEDGGLNWDAQAQVNIPLVSERLGARIALFKNSQSGVQDRVISRTGARHKNVDVEDSTGIIASLAWTPAQDLEIVPKFMYQEVTSDGFPYADIYAGNVIQERAYDVAENFRDRWYLPSLAINYDLGWGKLTYSGSHFDRRFTDGEDWSEFVVFLAQAFFGATLDAPSLIAKVQKEKVDSHELRMSTRLDGRFQFVGGLFHSKSETAFTAIANTPGFAAATGTTDLLIEVPAPGESQTTTEYALFGELSIAVRRDLDLILGGRYSGVKVALDRPDRLGLLAGPGLINSTKESRTTPKVSLQYKVSDDAMVYGLASQGFRPGGPNATLPTSAACNTAEQLAQYNALKAGPDFKSDALWNYELGAKTTWMDRRLKINAAIFDIDWKDIQQNVTVCGFDLAVNAGDARSRGAELEIASKVRANLELDLNVSYTDAKITTDVPLIADRGDRVKYIPDWQVSAAAQYDFPLFGGDGYIRASASYLGTAVSTFSPELEPYKLQRPFTDAGLRVGRTEGAWDLTLFADNLLNEHRSYGSNTSLGVELPERPRFGVNRPRTVGVQFKYQFER